MTNYRRNYAQRRRFNEYKKNKKGLGRFDVGGYGFFGRGGYIPTGSIAAEAAEAEENYTYDSYDAEYDITSASVTISSAGTFRVYGNSKSTSNTITVSASEDVVVVLDNVVISSSSCPLTLSNSATTTLVLSGTNTLKSSGQNPGIYKNTTGYLVIAAYGNDDSAGSLTATGGSNSAGIGGGYGGSSRNITVNSGTVTATGGDYGAGIGGGNSGGGGSNITINGGTVTAIGNRNGAGIGGGYGCGGSSITINGGTVTATGGTNGAGIGGGYNNSGSNITISGGTVTATGGYAGAGIGNGYKGSGSSGVKIFNSSVKISSISVTPTNADGESVYLYTIPDTTEGDSLIVDGETYIESIAHHTSSDANQYIYLTENSVYAETGDSVYLLSYSGGSTSVQKITDFYKTVNAIESLDDCLALDAVYDSIISYYIDDDGYICAAFTVGEYVLYTAQLEAVTDITDLEIPNAAALCLFADIVNSGNTTINGTVTANIDLTDTDWTPIGNSSYKYSGTFDGGGYVVSNLYYSDSSTNYVGLFGYVYGGTVKNTGIEKCYIYGKNYVGGICGYSSNSSISNCYNTGSVSGSGNYIGGICGYNNNSSTLDNCYNTGGISSNYYAGGICGINYSTVSRCYNSGSVSSSNDNSGGICGINYSTVSCCYNSGSVSGVTYTGGICGYNYKGSVSNCYNIGNVNGDYYTGGICGSNSDGTVSSCYYLSGTAEGGINSSDVSSSAEEKTADEFAGGEVTYLLNGSSSDSDSINFYQNIDNSETADTYPVLDDSHGTVYYFENYYYCPYKYESLGYTNTNNSGNSISHTYVNNICKYCGDINLDSLSTDEDGNYIYEISNADELVAFETIVNAGNTSLYGVLTADIDMTDIEWTPIGSSSSAYTGTFDGQGHVISNLTFDDDSQSYVGLFGYIQNGGTIKNVGIKDSSITGSSEVGGICGFVNSWGYITNCYFDGSVSGDLRVGGICGSSYGEIKNCYNLGTIYSINSYVGGICGYAGSSISNCYNAGSVSGNNSSTVGAIIGYNYYGSHTNNYYLSGTASRGVGSGTDTTTAVSSTQFASGEVAYLLNGSSSDSNSINFYQNIDNSETADTYPVLDDSHGTVYYIEAYYYCPDSYISVYSNKEDSGNSTSHTYVNNICEYCGDINLDSLSTDEDGNKIYEISNADQLAAFATIVNAGNKNLNGVVKADIDLSGIEWTPIGKSTDTYYAGTFDGGNHTISNMTITASSDCVGLFGCMGNSNDRNDTGTIKNLTVNGNITLSDDCENVGGIIGLDYNGVIENVVSEVNITNTSGLVSFAGGIVGYLSLVGATAKKCVYKGNISLANSSTINYIGGIAGTANGTSTVTYCYNLGSISASDSSSSYVGGILGLLSSGSFKNLSYCYNYGSLSAYASENCGAIIGQFGGASSATISNNYWLDTSSDYAFGTNNSTFEAPASSTAEEFESGKITYLLNGSSSENLTWYQTIGSDSYPVFDDTHDTVYYVVDYYYCPDYYETVNTYMNDTGNTETHTYEGESCKYCGQDVAEGSLSKDESGNYIISTAEELAAFANLVNTGFTSINGIVTANIDFTDYTDTMIGSADYPYSGTFDGSGYTITLNYNSSEANAALISYASRATIKNLNTAGTITTSAKFAAGILGYTASSTSAFTTISGCSSSVNIVSTVDGDGTHGGIAGALNASYDVVENCYFNGSITGSSTTNCAGIVGWLTVATISVENCYVSAEYSLSGSDSGSYNIARGRTSGVSNCYYLNAICSSASDGTQKTADEFAGGGVAYLLNGSVSGGTTWHQNIDSGTADSFPVLDNSHSPIYTTSLVYCPNCSEIGGYSNTEGKTTVAEEGSSTEHSYVNGVCKYCGAIDSSSSETDENGNYIISTPYQLAVFAATVNSGSTNINGIVTADIDFTDYTTTMIGSSSYPYAGTFDGGGYTITVSYEATGTGDIGLFSYVTGGTVKNLVVEGNIDFTDAPKGDDNDGGYAHVGGAIGILTGSGGTASNIVSRVNITTPEDNAYPLHQAAGVVGSLQSYASVDKCIYEGTITVYKSCDCIGGIVGYSNDYCSITNCANLGTVYASGTGNTNTKPYVGGILGYINNGNFSGLQNCYNYGSISANDTTYCGAIVGWLRSAKSGAITNNYWLDSSTEKAFGTNASSGNTTPVSKTVSEFADGEVAYLLNSGDESGVWVQTIGTDSYPLFTASDSSSSKVAAVTSNGSSVYANIVTNGVELSTSGSELLGVIIDTDVYGGDGDAAYLNSVGVVINDTLYQLTNFYYVDDSREYSETETNRAFFPVTRDSNSSSGSVTVRGEATTSTTDTADENLLYFVTEATSGLTIKEAPEETNSNDSGETAATK